MEKAKNSVIWTEEGYKLFAKEGLEGIQIERLARILQSNKSSFYHYFGDLEVFCEELIRLHEKKSELFLSDVRKITTIDPEYLQLVIAHKIPIMFQIQLLRSRSNPSFYKAAENIDRREDKLFRELWSDYLGIRDNADLAMRYFCMVRDMFYARLSFQNFHYSFLHDLMTEARVVMQQITEGKVFEADTSLL